MIAVRGLIPSEVKVLPIKLEINIMVLVVFIVTEVEISIDNTISLSDEIELLIDIISKVLEVLLPFGLNVLKMISELVILMSKVELLSESVSKVDVLLDEFIVLDTASLAIELLLLTINPV